MKLQHSIIKFRGFTFIELLVVIAIVVLAGGCCYAHFSRGKTQDQSVCCNCNLKQVGLAFRMWGDDNGGYPMRFRTNNFDGPSFAIQQKMYVYFQAMSNELVTPTILTCPADNRMPATNFSDLRNTNISYFVGMNADETMPQMLLAGDRNLTINGVPASTGLVNIKSTDTIGWTQERHRGQGNVALADGSVQGMRQVPGQPGTNITRLAVP